MSRLTPREKQCLDAIRRHFDDYREPPVLKVLASDLGCSATQAHRLVDALEEKGHLVRGLQLRGVEPQGPHVLRGRQPGYVACPRCGFETCDLFDFPWQGKPLEVLTTTCFGCDSPLLIHRHVAVTYAAALSDRRQP